MPTTLFRTALLVAVAAAIAVGCGRFGGPRTYEEAMRVAKAASIEGAFAKVYDSCARAFELADKARNGSQAIPALECQADAAARIGKTNAVIPAYARVIGTYAKELSNSMGRFRLRHEYGMALYVAGKQEQAIAVLGEALTAYKGGARAGWDTFWERLHIVRNLAKMYAKQGASAASAAFALEWADEIEAHVGRHPNGFSQRMGAGAALEALADIISIDDPSRAAKTRAIAVEQAEGEAEYVAANPIARKGCHKFGNPAGPLERCFANLP